MNYFQSQTDAKPISDGGKGTGSASGRKSEPILASLPLRTHNPQENVILIEDRGIKVVSMWQIFGLIHLFGLAFGVGAVTVNLVLMMKSRSDKEFAPVFMRASKPIANLVFLGLTLLTVSGIGFAALGYPEKQLLLVKHILIAVLWVNGLFVMFSLSPKLTKLAPKPGQPPTQEFFSIQRQVQVMGTLGIILWYTITVMSVWL